VLGCGNDTGGWVPGVWGSGVLFFSCPFILTFVSSGQGSVGNVDQGRNAWANVWANYFLWVHRPKPMNELTKEISIKAEMLEHTIVWARMPEQTVINIPK
jgi:hypothetical protein